MIENELIQNKLRLILHYETIKSFFLMSHSFKTSQKYMIDLFTHLPTTAYPPGTMGVTASPEFTPSGNHVAMASPTSRPNAAPEDEKSDADV